MPDRQPIPLDYARPQQPRDPWWWRGLLWFGVGLGLLVIIYGVVDWLRWRR